MCIGVGNGVNNIGTSKTQSFFLKMFEHTNNQDKDYIILLEYYIKEHEHYNSKDYNIIEK